MKRTKYALVRSLKFLLLHTIIRSSIIFAAIFPVFHYVSIPYSVNSGYAETGEGKDIFKVVMSIFGIKKETGDITATVTVDRNSRVKTFHLNQTELSTQDSSNQKVLKFVAAFPHTIIKSEQIYNACVVKLNDMHLYCQQGKNSSTRGPEFVDIFLDGKIKRTNIQIENINYLENEDDQKNQNQAKNVLPNYSEKK